MGKGGYSLVSPFYERLGGLWRCPRNEIGDMLPGGQKCIHLVAVLLFAVTQCRFKPLQIGRRLNTQAKKKKKKGFFPEGRGDDSTNQLFSRLASILYICDRSVDRHKIQIHAWKRCIFLLNIDIERNLEK